MEVIGEGLEAVGEAVERGVPRILIEDTRHKEVL